MSFFNELKRRNVFKVGIAYLVIAWLVAQVLQLVFEIFGTPDWVIKTVLVLLAAGLPLALFFAWAFELTPDGIRRESEVDRSQSITPQTGRKLNYAIYFVMTMALAYFAYDKFVLSADRETAVRESAENVIPNGRPGEPDEKDTDNTIAVLPFVNMSSDPEQEFFSDGISEELLNGLAKIDGLKVAARTSSFSFKGQNLPVGEIASVLGVDHILEGSVRKAGQQIRVTAQLIRVSDGFHMWSETYDRELDNIFAIQDEITGAIVRELRLRLSDQPSQTIAGTDNAEAYQEYLRGLYFWNLREPNNLYLAIEHFDRATGMDPDYADAWVGLGESWVLLPVWEFDYEKAPGQMEKSRQAAETALKLKPGSGRAHNVLAYRHLLRGEWEESLANFERAVSYEPENATAWHWYAGALSNYGRKEEAGVAFDKALKLDPRSRIVGSSMTEYYLSVGDYEAALDRIDKTLDFAPDFIFGLQVKGFTHLLREEYNEARAAFQTIINLAGVTRSDLRIVDLVEEYATRGKLGNVPEWLDDPKRLDPFYIPLVLTLAGQYESALDAVERHAQSTIPHTAVFWLNSQFLEEKLGDRPRYRELVKQLATPETGAG